MVDIHSHLLPNVDDGSDDVTTSIENLRQAYAQGVTDMILTPHYRDDSKNVDNLFEKFSAFKEQVKQSGIGINLYLGREIYVEKDYKHVIEQEEVATLNGTKYVLIEFEFDTERDVVNIVYELVRCGYVPIVAHFARYDYLNLQRAYEIKDAGGLIQINANEIVGKTTRKKKKLINDLFKNCLVDFVASDMHLGRQFSMEKARAKVLKKYGQNAVDAVFCDNAKDIIQGQS
jgi:protein-tyrosine phosphatase